MNISLITVTFNSAATLRNTIQSVLAQSYSNIEYIIVDGDSKDNTIDIIREYESLFSGRLHWVSETDKGLYDAMNKGIRMATGDIVGIINSDDFYHRTDILTKVMNAFQDKVTQAVYGDVRFVNPDNLDKTVRYYSSKKFTPRRFRYGFMPAHPTFFTYRKYFDEFGIGESLGEDTFSKDGLVWIPNILENWKNELPSEPSTMKVELYFNGTLAIRMSK